MQIINLYFDQNGMLVFILRWCLPWSIRKYDFLFCIDIYIPFPSSASFIACDMSSYILCAFLSVLCSLNLITMLLYIGILSLISAWSFLLEVYVFEMDAVHVMLFVDVMILCINRNYWVVYITSCTCTTSLSV